MNRRKLERMLDDWGTWEASLAAHIGWNVSPIQYGDAPVFFQKRNDTYQDSVFVECKRLGHEQRVALTVETAIRELPRRLRLVVRARHRWYPQASDAYIASQLALSQQAFSNAKGRAYQQLDSTLWQLSREYRAAC